MVGVALRSGGWDWFTQPLRGLFYFLEVLLCMRTLFCLWFGPDRISLRIPQGLWLWVVGGGVRKKWRFVTPDLVQAFYYLYPDRSPVFTK